LHKVGVLFGLGFDTASSIALLAVTALARKTSSGEGTLPRSRIIVLPLLFTAGMTLVDSIDSCIMLYSYAGIPEEGWSLFKKKSPSNIELPVSADLSITGLEDSDGKRLKKAHQRSDLPPKSNNTATSLPLLNLERPVSSDQQISESRVSANSGALQERIRQKQHTMSSLSIILTLISILVCTSSCRCVSNSFPLTAP
jgi:high-affinity nickel-transport protein